MAEGKFETEEKSILLVRITVVPLTVKILAMMINLLMQSAVREFSTAADGRFSN